MISETCKKLIVNDLKNVRPFKSFVQERAFAKKCFPGEELE
jgi:hypothetical protein